jgi:hypothetical protein
MPSMTDTADFLANVTATPTPMTVEQFKAYMASFVFAPRK